MLNILCSVAELRFSTKNGKTHIFPRLKNFHTLNYLKLWPVSVASDLYAFTRSFMNSSNFGNEENVITVRATAAGKIYF